MTGLKALLFIEMHDLKGMHLQINYFCYEIKNITFAFTY